jgi:hypothetical protein
MDAHELDEVADERAIFHGHQKRLDPIDSPRALGPKRFALRARKHQQPVVDWHVGLLKTHAGNDGCVLISRDGMIAFAISRTKSGLCIEKRCCPHTGPRTSHAMIFVDEAIFDRWCNVEPTRFDDPVLWNQLRRCGHDLFPARA